MRATFRTPIQGNVHFTARSGPKGAPYDGDGFLHDVSTSGLCFITNSQLTCGDPIMLDIISGETRLAFKGEVMHTGESQDGFVVGVRFDIEHPATEESLQMLAILAS